MLAEIVDFGVTIGLFAGGPTIALAGMLGWEKYMDNKRCAKSRAEIFIDGKTQLEWYELILAMGKDNYEHLSLAPLDGLERSTEVTWDVERLMGKEYWTIIKRQWYPETFCKHCKREHCQELCWQAQEAKAAKRDADYMHKIAATAAVKSSQNPKPLTKGVFDGNLMQAGRLMVSSEFESATGTTFKYHHTPGAGTVKVTAVRGDYTASTNVTFAYFNNSIKGTKAQLNSAIDKKMNESDDVRALRKEVDRKRKELELQKDVYHYVSGLYYNEYSGARKYIHDYNE